MATVPLPIGMEKDGRHPGFQFKYTANARVSGSRYQDGRCPPNGKTYGRAIETDGGGREQDG